MGWFQIQEPEDIAGIIEALISQRADLTVRIRHVGLPCSSKLLAILPALEPHGPSVRSTGRWGLLIEDLAPEHGDDLIQDFPEVDIQFGIHEYGGRFRTSYQGISSHYPHYGLSLDFPDSVAIQERGRPNGYDDDELRPFAAEFRSGGSGRGRVYEMPVISWSECGLGLWVTARNTDLMTLLKRGERIPEITLFAESGLLVLEGVVRHKWKVNDAIHQRGHILDLAIRTEADRRTQRSDLSNPWARKTPQKVLSIV